MTTVTESYPLPMRPDERWYPDALLTRLCPWPQRRCFASQLRPVKNEDGGTWESQTEDLSVIIPQNAHPPIPPAPSISPVSSLSSLSAGNGDDLVINPEMVNSAIAFHLNIYLHLNRHSEGPSLPSRAQRRYPDRSM